MSNSFIPYNTSEFGIFLTSSCNLSCSYCFEHGKNVKIIELNDAIRFIDIVFKQKNSMITFKLLGGEILLYPELVNSIIGYINFKATLTNIRYRIIITTNGTQLSNIKVKKILDRWKYVINYGNISFDGSPICHDINRVFKDGTGSAAHILNNVKISKQYLLSSNMGFIYTISKNTIRYIKNSIQYFVSNMFNLKMSFEFDFLINSEKELKETVDEFNGL